MSDRPVLQHGSLMESLEGLPLVHHESGPVPTFLLKLVSLLAEDSNHEYINWSESGTSFIVKDTVEFSKVVLPKYFKHNKFASFVRQLNMYGFRKITSLTQSGLKFEREEVEFYHCMFIRGQEYLLENIKRKVNKPDEASRHHAEDVTKVLAEVKQMKGHQEAVDARLSELKQENEDLWREVVTLRQKHSHQQKVVNKLIQFLVNLVQQHGGVKRKLPLMIEDGSSGAVNYVPAQKYSKQLVYDPPEKSPAKPASPTGPTVSFPESVRPYNENQSEEGPSIIEVGQENPSETISPGPLNVEIVRDTLPVPTAAGTLHSPSDPDFDMSEYINPNSLPSSADDSSTDDFPDVLTNLIGNPNAAPNLQGAENNAATTGAQARNGNQQTAVAAYGGPTLARRLSHGDLREHVDGMHQSLSNLFNSNQVQLDYDLIQELFSSSPDIMPPAGVDPADPRTIVGTELMLHPGSNDQQDN